MATTFERIFRCLRGFGANESGLSTVEWSALAGAVVIGGIFVVWLTMNSLKAPSQTIANTVTCTAQGSANC
jgi:hypothetical protein